MVDDVGVESTKMYRIALYIEAATCINDIHASLVSGLHALTPPPTNHSNPTHSSNHTAEPKRATEQIYEPLGTAKLQLRYKDHEGYLVVGEVELGTRISVFAKRMEKEAREIDALQRKWENVVGEIWACGEEVLGRDGMERLGLLRPVGDEGGAHLKIKSKEMLLFVPEDGDLSYSAVAALAQRGSKSSGASAVSAQLPRFIQRTAAKSAKGKRPASSRVEEKIIREIEKKIDVLGQGEIAEMRKLEKEYQRRYDQKMKKVLDALENDDDDDSDSDSDFSLVNPLILPSMDSSSE